MSEMIHICEVSLRDGLQNEPVQLTVEEKIQFYDGFVEAGLNQIEIGSFVNPKIVPAMANTDELAKRIMNNRPFKTQVLGLVMNEKGLDRAIASGVDGVCIVIVISESLCLKNNRCTTQESTDMAIALMQRAREQGLFVRIDVATAWVCPFEGQISLERVKYFSDQIWEHQPNELAFCDSIGHAHPFQVAALFAELSNRYDSSRLVAHFHDTKAMGLANATAALLNGVRRFDASLAGLGACPFAPGAKGNLATENLIQLCENIGFMTNVSLDKLRPLSAKLIEIIGRTDSF